MWGIVGVGIFLLICGYLAESRIIMLIAAFVLLGGFGLSAAKTKASDPKTGKPYYKCPNCGATAGEEIPPQKAENGKIYKCKLCNYKW